MGFIKIENNLINISEIRNVSIGFQPTVLEVHFKNTEDTVFVSYKTKAEAQEMFDHITQNILSRKW